MKLQDIINRASGEVRDMLIEYQIETVKNAVRTLSFTELTAVKAILADRKMEKMFSAKEIATSNNITRSILVGAMDKMQCAGILKTQSMGCKGSRLEVLNDKIFDIVEAA